MLKTIPISDLTVDMYIAEIIATPTMPMPRKKRGMVRDSRIIKKFIEIGVEQLLIDTSKGLDIHHHDTQHNQVEPKSQFERSIEQDLDNLSKQTNTHYQDLHLEWGSAKEIFTTSINIISASIGAIKEGQTVNQDHFDKAAKAISRSIMRNKDALTWLGKVRDTENYLLEHSVNTSILMGIFAQAYGFNSEQIEQCITGALLHDLGHAQVLEEAFKHKRPLTKAEYKEVKTHVRHGIQVLANNESIPDIAMSIVFEHHERYDGSGYPNALKEDEISLFGRMFAIVDTYDAITNNRIYRDAVPSSYGMRTLLKLCNSHFDESLVHLFIKSLGVYPTGSLARLNNDFLAVVIAQNPNAPLKPLVKVVYNTKTSTLIDPKMIDLSMPTISAKIVSYEDPRVFNIEISEFMPDEMDL